MSESTRTILLVILVTLIALAGGHFVFKTGRKSGSRTGKKPGSEGMNLVRITTLAYLALGLILGDYGFGLVDGRMVDNLEPVLELSLGWIGILFGLQFDWKLMKRYQPSYFRVAAMQSLFTIFLIWLCFYLTVTLVPSLSGSTGIWQACLMLTLIGAVSSPSATALIARSGIRMSRKLTRLVHFTSSIDPLIPIIAFAFVLRSGHAESFSIVSGLEWLLISVLVGVVLGAIFYSCARHPYGQRELTLLIIGFAVFTGGICTYLGLSTLLVSVTVGITLANLLGNSERIFRVLSAREKPLLLILLVIVGASWQIDNGHLAGTLWIVPVYIVARFFSQVVGWMLSFPKLADKELEKRTVWSGLALYSQGGMALALIANLQVTVNDPWRSLAVTGGLVGVVLAEIFGGRLAALVLREQDGKTDGKAGRR